MKARRGGRTPLPSAASAPGSTRIDTIRRGGCRLPPPKRRNCNTRPPPSMAARRRSVALHNRQGTERAASSLILPLAIALFSLGLSLYQGMLFRESIDVMQRNVARGEYARTCREIIETYFQIKPRIGALMPTPDRGATWRARRAFPKRAGSMLRPLSLSSAAWYISGKLSGCGHPRPLYRTGPSVVGTFTITPATRRLRNIDHARICTGRQVVQSDE